MGVIRIELMTSSMSTKRSTTELHALINCSEYFFFYNYLIKDISLLYIFSDQYSAFCSVTLKSKLLGGENNLLVSSNLPFFIVSNQIIKSALKISRVWFVGHIKSAMINFFLFF